MSPTVSSTFETERQPVRFAHTVSEAGRLLPSASRWSSIQLDYKLVPKSSIAYDSIPSQYPKSVDYNLVITDRKHFHRFVFVLVSIIFAILAAVLLVHFLHQKHKHQDSSINLKLAINQALTFYDAQKSGHYPRKSPVKFRGDSGLEDGSSANASLTGGFYDSGNNIKFTFTTAYTMTLLSWSAIEYQSKYADIGELDHVRDIIRWGSDYLLKVFIPPNSTVGSHLTLYSQVGSTISNNDVHNDISCWQRPENMSYPRPVSICDSSATDLGGEVVAALSAASMVFKEEEDYSGKLVQAAESLYEAVISEDPTKQGTYTMVDECGKQAIMLYNSSGYKDELAWGATWLFLATNNAYYLANATDSFISAKSVETNFDKGIFYWNNKLEAVAVLLTGIRYFRDPGFPHEDVLKLSSNSTDSLMCSYLFNKYLSRTAGGLIIMEPDNGSLLQYAATASFLSKLYSDYLDHLKIPGASCNTDVFSVAMLRDFASSQVNYILGQNPMKMSYLVGYGDKFSLQVHHRSASIPWGNRSYNCDEGKGWLNSKDPNPQVLLGAMVGGPDTDDKFTDLRSNGRFTEPNIASNAGLVAALIALQDPPYNSRDFKNLLWG
ncbi:endoglucanase 25-like [Gastrolobium bilobum]|uniref:endoglucanase 25-like n=1 Tax=Gastrolobium bilobum TaxID=150636 RepID=UPI002AB092E6|nr:endoglucanase 25-like [Gastrolobium bilobum]